MNTAVEKVHILVKSAVQTTFRIMAEQNRITHCFQEHAARFHIPGD
jgi:hypothetical protein